MKRFFDVAYTAAIAAMAVELLFGEDIRDWIDDRKEARHGRDAAAGEM
jgi:hypothetical protein